MSYFSVGLRREAEARNLSRGEIARRCGLSPSFIGRVMSGESRELTTRNIVAILEVFGDDPVAQADLVAARCMDARVGPGSELVEISVKIKRPPPSDREEEQLKLARETERAFAWLRNQCPLNPDLEKHLVGYARLTGMK